MASPSPKEMNWSDAKNYCSRQGWRLPTVDELLSLFMGKKVSSALASHEGMNDGFYWSSTPRSGSSSDAGVFSFRVAVPGVGYHGVGSYHRVRCVR